VTILIYIPPVNTKNKRQATTEDSRNFTRNVKHINLNNIGSDSNHNFQYNKFLIVSNLEKYPLLSIIALQHTTLGTA
jgi:hypothetical protein